MNSLRRVITTEDDNSTSPCCSPRLSLSSSSPSSALTPMSYTFNDGTFSIHDISGIIFCCNVIVQSLIVEFVIQVMNMLSVTKMIVSNVHVLQ